MVIFPKELSGSSPTERSQRTDHSWPKWRGRFHLPYAFVCPRWLQRDAIPPDDREKDHDDV